MSGLPRTGGGRRILARPYLEIPKNLRLPYQGSGGRGLRANYSEDNCECATIGAARCAWHLGMASAPRVEREAIPMIRGLSRGAWLLYLVIWRGTRWAIDRSRKEGRRFLYDPGHHRFERAVGGRNARTRERDDDGRFLLGPSSEKGKCSPATVTAYLAELQYVRLADSGAPLLHVQYGCRRTAQVYLNPDLIAPDRKTEYRVVRPADVRRTDPPSSLEASAASGEPDGPDPILLTPDQLRSRIEDWQNDLQSLPRSDWAVLVLGEAEAAPWWDRLCRQTGGALEARHELRRMIRYAVRDGADVLALLNALDRLSYEHSRGNTWPDTPFGWLGFAARNGLKPPVSARQVQQEERLEAAVAAKEEREREEEARREEAASPEERARWVARMHYTLEHGKAASADALTGAEGMLD